MLTFTTEQMKQLKAYMGEQFTKRLIVHLQKKLPDHTKHLSNKEMKTFVQDSIKKAATYNIENENDVRRFAEYATLYGTEMDCDSETKWIGDTLRRQDIDGTAKMDLIDSLELQMLRE